MSCQATDGDVDQFFGHENHACSPSLSLGGKRSLGSNVLPCIEVQTATSAASPLVDATFLDGAVVVQMLNPGIAKTFMDYVEQVFCHSYQQSSKTPLVQMCAETSYYICSDSKAFEGFRAR